MGLFGTSCSECKALSICNGCLQPLYDAKRAYFSPEYHCTCKTGKNGAVAAKHGTKDHARATEKTLVRAVAKSESETPTNGIYYVREQLRSDMPKRLLELSGPAVPYVAIDTVDVSALSCADFWHKYVKHNLPVLIKNGARHWAPVEKWSVAYMKEKSGAREIVIRKRSSSGVFGNVAAERGEIYAEEKMSFAGYLDEMATKGKACDVYAGRMIVEKDLPELFPDVPDPETEKFRKCFGEKLFTGAIMYMGAGGQATPIHYDREENLIHVVHGSKTLRIWHPSYFDMLSPNLYGFNYSSIVIPPDNDSGSTAEMQQVFQKHPLFAHAKSLEVTIHVGDVFYLPFAWYHLVKGGDGMNTIVNHWFGMRSEKLSPGTEREVVFD